MTIAISNNPTSHTSSNLNRKIMKQKHHTVMVANNIHWICESRRRASLSLKTAIYLNNMYSNKNKATGMKNRKILNIYYCNTTPFVGTSQICQKSTTRMLWSLAYFSAID